jgi:membrane-bound inhibitor of C-type lysozyme
MNWAKTLILVASFAAAGLGGGAPRLFAQTAFQSYRCGDGTKFIVAFYPGDNRAHMQIDGREVTLANRFAMSGTRYSGGGVSLQITRAGAIRVRHVNRPLTACEQI